MGERLGHCIQDGSFTLPDVSADRYLVSITGLPEGYYAKSIRLGKESVLESGAEFTQKPEEPLEVVLSAKAVPNGRVSRR